MKKILSLIAVFGILFYVLQSCNNCPPCNQENVVRTDSTGTTSGTIVSDSVGTNQWYVTVIVKTSKASAVSDALVSLPCAGMEKNTGPEGVVTFTGLGSCPCGERGCKAYITKEGSCTDVEVPINRGCGQVYTGYCE